MIRTKAYLAMFPLTALGLLSYTLIVYIRRVGGIAAHGPLVPMVLFLWSMSIVTYAMLWSLPPGYVQQHDQQRQQQQTANVCFVEATSGGLRHCKHCDLIKPDRAHHCSRCNRCILKMDHHCPWIGGCVGQDNQRLFLIFLGYTAAYAGTAFVSLCIIRRNDLVMCWDMYKLYWYTLLRIFCNIYQIIQQQQYVSLLSGVYGWSRVDIHLVITLMQGFLFTAVLWGFTGFHLFLVLNNRTTIEHYGNRPYAIRVTWQDDGGGSDHNHQIVTIRGRELPFSRGIVQNWMSVMGTNPICWLVPVMRGRSKGSSSNYHHQTAHFIQAVREKVKKAT